MRIIRVREGEIMKKKNRTVNSFVSNNPMLDTSAETDMPIIAPEAYDAPLPYTRSDAHVRMSGNKMHKIKYPTVNSVDEYDAPPVIFTDNKNMPSD